ncbi:MAG: ABC transporter ATP-binding protein [Kiloniellales bacterium]
MRFLRYFERLIDPTALSPETPPPTGLLAFYWHYARQAGWLLVALFVSGFFVAVLDSAIPFFIGRLVTLLSTYSADRLLAETWPTLLAMAVIVLLLRPAAVLLQHAITNQALVPGLTNLIRWQSHWHVVRQSWTFFQNDFAGRIANRVMQTGPALRESVIASTNAVWYILVYGTSAFVLLSANDLRLTLPLVLWFVGYVTLLRILVPRMRERSHALSEARSTLTGRIVDSYTNILTVKLFASARDEDSFAREAVDEHTGLFRQQLRLITALTVSLATINAALVVGTGAIAVWLWIGGNIQLGAVAMALPLTWQIASMAGWVAQSVASIFENIGTVQEGMRSIAVPLQMTDRPGAVPLAVTRGEVRFEGVQFGYGQERSVLRGIDLTIAPGERVGLVGQSGAGKSTLVNLLLRFYAPEAGRILIDGRDIADVRQESLRGHIAVVTQDTSLLHRSIRDNIRYGRPQAAEGEIRDAAERAQALDFIDELVDWRDRRGLDSHVGERGVKLSGGQRQRIAIARALLKDAPIVVLDEATSSLDSEVEASIQENFDELMRGRTVIAIAHRLSTIARMNRLVVLERGRIVEQGSHAELLVLDGVYAGLWRRQSGGFLDDSPQVPGPLRPAMQEIDDSSLPSREAHTEEVAGTQMTSRFPGS